jgi:Ca-activated chloride channel homolog
MRSTPAQAVFSAHAWKPRSIAILAHRLSWAVRACLLALCCTWLVGCEGRTAPQATQLERGTLDAPRNILPPNAHGRAVITPPDALQATDGEEDRQQLANTDAFDHIIENPFLDVLEQPQSTFSIDVDTAAYSVVRRFLTQGQLPPKGAVRIEELVNYFTYDYPEPQSEHPFSVDAQVTACPWQPNHKLLRVGLKGRSLELSARPASNLVFLIDVSGSMDSPQRLPLVQQSLRMLVEQLDERDRVAMVVYAGSSGLVLPSTAADRPAEILSAIDRLKAGGSTNGGAGIRLAYDVAREHFVKDGINRVVLCTDGDFNVGVTSQSELVELIEQQAQSGVFLTVLGFGLGNYKDSTMEKLADHGNGSYAYIDTLLEARKVLVEQAAGTLLTIAKDVKIQLDFNPLRVQAYRLIGYENRVMHNRDFRDDRKDAGEIGAGHTVTAFYELVPAGAPSPEPAGSTPEFVQRTVKPGVSEDTWLVVNLRYKQPAGDSATEFRASVDQAALDFAASPPDLQFAAAVCAYGLLLRDSQHKGATAWDWVVETAEKNLGADRLGLRGEFVQLAKTARRIASPAEPHTKLTQTTQP